MDIESNPCISCGKERIKRREGTVLLGSIKTKITVYVCPDKICQKGVEKKIAEKEQKALNRISSKKTAKPA